MLKKLSHIFIMFSVIITVSHNIIAHHHHFESGQLELVQHQEKEDGNHSLFSFGQLDEHFPFTYFSTTISNDANIVLFISPLSISANTADLSNAFNFIPFQELHSSDESIHYALRRGPPPSFSFI
jgi:hypothetical protein